MNNVYVGYDSREDLAFDVAKHSILNYGNNVTVFPLKLNELPMLTRPVERREDGSMWCAISEAPCTEFSISRFALSFIQRDGWALFMDCDMVALADLDEIFALADDKYAVMVVKHKQEGEDTESNKWWEVQKYYSRKNWSSVMLWNCSHPANKNLTLEMLNTLPGRELHRFCWLKDEEIGELPKEWNHLIDVNPPSDNIKIAHYTYGGPWIENWRKKESDKIWNDAYTEYYKKI